MIFLGFNRWKSEQFIIVRCNSGQSHTCIPVLQCSQMVKPRKTCILNGICHFTGTKTICSLYCKIFTVISPLSWYCLCFPCQWKEAGVIIEGSLCWNNIPLIAIGCSKWDVEVPGILVSWDCTCMYPITMTTILWCFIVHFSVYWFMYILVPLTLTDVIYISVSFVSRYIFSIYLSVFDFYTMGWGTLVFRYLFPWVYILGGGIIFCGRYWHVHVCEVSIVTLYQTHSVWYGLWIKLYNGVGSS